VTEAEVARLREAAKRARTVLERSVLAYHCAPGDGDSALADVRRALREARHARAESDRAVAMPTPESI